ncbi:c-type cytochrome [Geoalkalibacter halelectricus]|uniref:C-type cytochrome n=1 Tax=Geoalkalibacter halelectricus TaxID=2847045 RepID=A0ABY5ZQ52_9BACT|nr:c-type cytochrome [Geoalkalibacter halelectricus]MDO3377501.1 c-type cytochrome [Geoalkalibacter halelectricus]UWZ80738.1 c-type cytochrome [Geoalkalibacter halelectricus]
MLENHQHQRPAREFDDGLIEMRSTPVPRYFTFLFYGLIIWAALFMAYYLLSGWSSEGEFQRKMDQHIEQVAAQQPPPGAPATAAAQDLEGARRLYSQHCAACHGASGQGGIGPALDVAQYKYGRDQATVMQSIAQGRPAGMPAYANQFSTAQIESLSQYLIGL